VFEHARRGGHQPGVRPATQDGDGPLESDPDPEGVREVAVEPGIGDLRYRREAAGGVGPVEADEAFAYVAAESRPDPGGGGRRRAGDLDPIEGEDSRLPGTEVRADTRPDEHERDREDEQGPAAARRRRRRARMALGHASFASPRTNAVLR
jgi:hypothetical protein